MTIEERFEKLEEEVKTLREQKGRLRRLSLASVALALAALIGGTALSVRAYTAAIEPTSITTTSITLKDSSGRTRFALNGLYGTFNAFDVNGKLRAVLGSGGNIATFDANEKLRVRLFLGGSGDAVFYDEKGKVRANINWGGNVGVSDSNGTRRVLLDAGTNKIYFWNSGGGLVAQYPQ